MIREKELRLALVCYGGVSLAVYMHGVTKEIWKLLRASEARKQADCPPQPHNDAPHAAPEDAGLGDTEPVWRALLEEIARETDLSVMVDILAGASAGGINAVLLANAIALGESLEPLTDMWLAEADVDHLLDPEARRRRLSDRLRHVYKEPVAWLAARQSASLASVDVPEVRAEVALKLAGFVRSRWFKPPFSGEVLTAMLDRAMDAMAGLPRTRPLVPPTLPLDLFVTVTDYWGVNTELAIHSPHTVTEREHRRLFAFTSPAVTRRHGAAREPALASRAPVAARPELLFAARATSSFPGAFPPATIGEVDRRMAERGQPWPGRAGFVSSQLSGDRPPEQVALIDGSVLNNAPFGPAIGAVRLRPAHREVDRRFVYIDPKPGMGDAADAALARREPGFFTSMFRALADIPREQPIRDSLERISALSSRVRRLKAVTDAMAPDVDAAIGRAVGPLFFLLPVTPARLSKARGRIQSVAAREAGFAFAAYAQLKVRTVLEEGVALLARAAALGPADSARLRAAVEEAAAARGAFAHDAALGPDPLASGYVRLLRQLDIGFRVRRLRFFVRRLTAGIAEAAPGPERQSAEALKARLHVVTAPFVARRLATDADDEAALAAAARAVLDAPAHPARVAAAGRAIDVLGERLALSGLDADADRVLVEALADPGVGRATRRDLVRAWLGFPFYDIAILPLMQEDAADSFEELKVDRISPDDATALRKGGARACLKGWQLNAFAAFFSRAYRENDYLWGRLHAAERLVDIVASAVPESSLDAQAWKRLLFEAILAAERPRLTAVEPLFDELEGLVKQWGTNRAP
jgi:patatin-related protein